MNTRLIPPLAALTILAASLCLYAPHRPERHELAPVEAALLPEPAPMPEPLDIPERMALFDSPGQDLRTPVAITQTPAKDSAYRLCAYAGGNGLWVVSLEDGEGHFHTLKSGEMLPGSTLEFKGMQFHTFETGLQKGEAVFYDQSSSSYIDVMALADKAPGDKP